jgi:hypothetical protein
VLALLGTGLRFASSPGCAGGGVHLERIPPVLQVAAGSAPATGRHTTDARALRVVEAIQARPTIALRVAEEHTPADRQGTWRVF